MRIRPGGSPERIPEELVLHRHLDAIESGEFVGRAVDRALRARAVVAADVDDERVVEVAEVFDRLDDAADLVVGVGLVGRVDVRLLDKELLLVPAERIPLRQLRAAVDILPVRPRGQLRALGKDAEFLLVGENGLAQFFPAVIEEVHRADLVDPFLGGVMRRMDSAGDVVHEEGLAGREFFELFDMLDRFIGHGRGKVPAGVVLEGINGRRVAKEVRLPLAGVAADKPVEILEAHADRPLIERPGLAVREKRRVMIFTEPRGRVSVVLQDRADSTLLNGDDRVVTGEAGRNFAHHAEARRVMVAAGDERRTGRRTERGRVEVRVAQPVLCDAVQSRRRNHAAKRARRPEPAVVGHDQ